MRDPNVFSAYLTNLLQIFLDGWLRVFDISSYSDTSLFLPPPLALSKIAGLPDLYESKGSKLPDLNLKSYHWNLQTSKVFGQTSQMLWVATIASILP
ncbi:hypothetical protein TNCV_3003791 [Trichonephila clavipes]|nr:hypothetical protein TNCV_3003791 [Trichonephila clavipes]